MAVQYFVDRGSHLVRIFRSTDHRPDITFGWDRATKRTSPATTSVLPRDS